MTSGRGGAAVGLGLLLAGVAAGCGARSRAEEPAAKAPGGPVANPAPASAPAAKPARYNPAPDAAASIETARIADVSVSVENAGGACVVWSPARGQGERLQTGLPWPCSFNREKGGAVRVFKVKGRPRFMLESSRRDAAKPGSCEVAARGVELGKEKLLLAKAINRSAGCATGPLDQMFFDFSLK